MGGNVVTYTCNNIATATTSSSAGEMTQIILSGWMYEGENQIFLTLEVNSNDDIKLNTKQVNNTVLDNTAKYTFVVDSNDAVFQWAHNIKDNGQDYTSVLVKKGEWGSNFEDLGIIGTKIIEGEPGAVLDSGMIPLGYSVKPNESDYYIRGLKVFGGLRNCVNITNCISSVFIGCSNLINCSSLRTMQNSDFSAKFEDCSNLTDCQAAKKWETAIIALWYPLLVHRSQQLDNMLSQVAEGFSLACRHNGERKVITAELQVAPAVDDQEAPRLYGSGMMILNCPYLLDEQLQETLPYLVQALAPTQGSWEVREWS